MQVSKHGYQHWTEYYTEGNQARVIGHFRREQKDAAVEPRTEFSMKFYGQGGGIMISVQAFAFRQPLTGRTMTRTIKPKRSLGTTDSPTVDRDVSIAGMRAIASPTRVSARLRLDRGVIDPWSDPTTLPPIGPVDPPLPPGGGTGGVMQAAVRIELFAPGITEAVQTWDLPEGITSNFRTVTYDPPGFPTPDAPVRRTGWWRVTVIPTGSDPVKILVEARATMTLTPFRTTAITTRLLDHLFRVVLEALVPRAEIKGRILQVGIGHEIAKELDISSVLKEVDISPIVSWAKLTSLNITAISGRDLKKAAEKRIVERRQAAEKLKYTDSYSQVLQSAEAYRKKLEDKLKPIQDDDITIRIQAGFANSNASVFGFEIARLNGELGEMYLSFSHSLKQMRVFPFFDVDFSTLADIVLSIASLFTEVKDDIVNTTIEDTLESPDIAEKFCTYLREVLGRAVSQNAVVHEVLFAGGAWQVRYYNDPPLPSENIPRIQPVHGSTVDGSVVEMARVSSTLAPTLPAEGAPTGTSESPRPSQPSDPLGVFPPGFQVEEGVALERLDRHKTLVFIMMENRSYDHLFGGLAAARPRGENGYDGPPSTASNASAGGFLSGVPMVETRKISMGTAIPVSPRHSYSAVQFQIGDGTPENLGTGAMNGFARDLERRTDSPQMAMTVYGEADLPVYYKLADEFCVCDRWFAAHPGPTWPNRIATITGAIPELENFENDDPRIGFLKEQTIFDILTRHGIDWKVFESDLSLIRMFDNFRLDDRHVVPIDDPKDGLDATLRSGLPLPRVMFVEPNFADIPPLATANDDHPPADLTAGQAFISRVCDAIWSSGHFGDCLVCITYDEHGGFYDHVPPPGTLVAEGGDPTRAGLKPKLHPDGPGYLGVRVPTLIISPYVSAGKVDRTEFDHTSFLKTILVHNRRRLPGSVLGSCGGRVNAAAHLGQVLDLSAPRQSPQPFDRLRRVPTTPVLTGVHLGEVRDVLTAGASLDSTPRVPQIPPRTVKIVSRPEPPEPVSDEPQDFHTALRNALKPRRK